MNADERERAGRRGAGWSGKAFKRSFDRHPENRPPKRAPAASYAAPPRSLTAAFCGDPPPGQSALDKLFRLKAEQLGEPQWPLRSAVKKLFR